MKLLTICIPTFNRINLLKQLLLELLPQAEDLKVDVFVSDNASSDGTGQFLDEISRNYECLSFNVNKKTVPIDENMFKAMSGKDSKYIYPLGDDDFLPNGILFKIVQELNKDIDLLILNYKLTDINFNPLNIHLPQELNGIVYEDPRLAFKSLWNVMHFGSFVVRNEIIRIWFDKYIGTSHAYAGSVWDFLAHKFVNEGKSLICCMKDESVILRSAGKTWKSDSCEIFLYGIPKWFNELPKLYDNEKIPIQNKYFSDNGEFYFLLKYRKKGQINLTNIKKLMLFFPKSFQHKAIFICILPVPLASLLGRVSKLSRPSRKSRRLK